MRDYPATTFKDQRGRDWETFVDESYYEMTCVRMIGDRYFNSDLNFHFSTSKQANEFIELLKIAS